MRRMVYFTEDLVMVDNKYNGWTNYETWLVNLWFDTSFEVNISAEEIREMIRDYICEFSTDASNGFISDMFNCFLSEVNYHEIAEHYIEEENPHYGNRWDSDFVTE